MSTTFALSAVGVLGAAVLAAVVMRDTGPEQSDESPAQEPELAA